MDAIHSYSSLPNSWRHELMIIDDDDDDDDDDDMMTTIMNVWSIYCRQ